MADNEYHLYIHFGAAGENSAMAGGAEGDDEDGKTTKTEADIKSAAKKLVGYAALKSTAEQMIAYPMSTVELSTGAREYEQRLQSGYSVAKQVWNAGEAIVIGALAGGPLGAIAGVAVSGFHTLISYSQRKRTLAMEEGLENISIGLMNIRAGVDRRRDNSQ